MTTPYTCECLRGESRQVCGRPATASVIYFDRVVRLCSDCNKFMDDPVDESVIYDRAESAIKLAEHYKRRAEDAEAVLSSLVREICNHTRMLDLREARAVLARVPKAPHLPPSLAATMPKVAPGVAHVPERKVVRVTLPGREEGPK